MSIHVVQAGDSLWSISQLYGTTVETIISVNGLNSIILYPGLALYIPNEGLPVRYHRIKYGDTLWSLSKQFNTTIPNILNVNQGINPNILTIGQKIAIPSPLKMQVQTLGYVVPYSEAHSMQIIKEYSRYLTYVAIVAYSLNEEGYIVRLLEDSASIIEAKRFGLSPLLMIRNIDFVDETFNAELIGNVLGNENYRRNLIQSLLLTIRNKGYSGISIDFEFVPPERRNEFNLFFKELKEAMGNEYILHVNVHAKTEDIPTNRIIGAYDYEVIGRYADIVAVMTMDYGYPTGPPNPVSPLWWMQQVIEYTIGLIDRRKLQVGLPLYGYDWKIPEYTTTARSILDAQNLAISTGAIIQYDAYAASPWYRYWEGVEPHIVWFEDIRSYVEKYALVDMYQLLGVTYWHMSLYFPQNWAYIERNMVIEKG